MEMVELFGFANGLLGAVGLWYVGRRRKLGWAIGAAAQVSQVAYGLMVGKWGLLTNVLMVFVYAVHFYRWRHLPWGVENPPVKENANVALVRKSDVDPAVPADRLPGDRSGGDGLRRRQPEKLRPVRRHLTVRRLAVAVAMILLVTLHPPRLPVAPPKVFASARGIQ